MAKIKLVRFEIAAILEESRRLIDFLRLCGTTELSTVPDADGLLSYQTDSLCESFERKSEKAEKCAEALEKYCKIKKPFLSSFSDCTEIELQDYRSVCDGADELMLVCDKINNLCEKISFENGEIIRQQTLIDYYKPWEKLDIPMSCVRTQNSSVFIGYFKEELSKDEIIARLASSAPEVDGVAAEVISSDKSQTCVCVFCFHEDKAAIEAALRENGFIKPDNPAKTLPSAAIGKCEKAIAECKDNIGKYSLDIASFASFYNKIRLLSEYYSNQAEKYRAVSRAATSERAIYLEGYVPERDSEQLKFEIERRFTAQMDVYEPDYEKDDVPVLLENKPFAAGVESISNMYSPPSNNDVDPNPVMSFFYYALFGLMLSDAGYGLLMVIAALVAKFKLKFSGERAKTVSFIFWCGISTMFWGALFGGWFGDLIPTICTHFLGMEKGPDLAIWFTPVENSMKLLMFSFAFGLAHLYAGLAIRFYMLARRKQWLAAFSDVVPVMIFVAGFAAFGSSLLVQVSPAVKSVGTKLLLVGAILIVLTSGRSSKNILGKLGGGLYGLYNTATGYLGDILSYSRLLALGLVTGVIANVVNMLAAMFSNVLLFVLVFLAGHTVNIAVNLIGTYVHTSRLQYVEFFSKFYEGGGRIFTPFRLNLKHFKIKEDIIND